MLFPGQNAHILILSRFSSGATPNLLGKSWWLKWVTKASRCGSDGRWSCLIWWTRLSLMQYRLTVVWSLDIYPKKSEVLSFGGWEWGEIKPSDFLLIFQCQTKWSGQATTGCQLSTATFPLLSDVMVPQNEPKRAHGLQLSILRLSTLAKGHLNLSGPWFPHLQSGPNDVRLTPFTQFFPWIE